MKKLWLISFCLLLAACSSTLKSLEPELSEGEERPLDIPPHADELPN